MPDTRLDSHAMPSSADCQTTEAISPGSVLLFGDEKTPPLWLWLAIEPDELTALEGALLEHLRSPLFPSRIGEGPLQAGDDSGLLEFAQRFGAIAGRFAQGSDLVLAATRVVTERGGPLSRQGALACVEALQYRLHAEARGLGAAAAKPARLRHFVLASRLAADLWLRHVQGPDSGRPLHRRLGDALGI
ncbi:hypothetical protein, partial [Paracraurococcus ruber]